MNDPFLSMMDTGIGRLVWQASRVAWRYPASFPTFFQLACSQKRASLLRASHRARGLSVPAFLIVSVTRRCNLKCVGCYSHASASREKDAGRPGELDTANLSRIIREGADLGVSFMLIAGGEPLVRASEVIEMARSNPRVIFPVFTNGTLIDDAMIRSFAKCRNLIPVLSVEGGASSTDGRRGSGVYEQAFARMRSLSRAGVFFGVSLTVMKGNVRELVSDSFVDGLMRAGAGLFFYNEYTPIAEGTESLCIDPAERAQLLRALEEHKRRRRAVFLAFPGDEDKFGGCLSAGRGFVHVAPDGSLEACPFAPFGDTSARDSSLAEALRSPLLGKIRSHHGELAETAGGCALWNRREWAENLVGSDVGSCGLSE